MTDPTEHRVVNEATGGAKGSKLARFDLLPPDVLWHVAEHFGRGAQKYADRNWERGYAWSLSFAALQRHLMAFWGGEDIDTENGTHHLDAVIFHAMVLRRFVDQHRDLDDRGTEENRIADKLQVMRSTDMQVGPYSHCTHWVEGGREECCDCGHSWPIDSVWPHGSNTPCVKAAP